MARRRVEALADNLKEAVSARDEFLSIAAHELKTPVTSLSMQLQMTRRGVNVIQDMTPPAAKLAKTLDSAISQVKRLTALIEDLLDVSRVESGKMTYRFDQVNLGELVQEVAERFAEQIRAAGCALKLQYRAKINIHCDRFRIEQVVTNLLTNAIKYGTGSTIVMELRALGAGAAISVTDQGMGIAADKQPRIFDRFERAISHRSISGLGLGLYISKQIVNAHGGDILLRSRLGEGSCFTVQLPPRPPS